MKTVVAIREYARRLGYSQAWTTAFVYKVVMRIVKELQPRIVSQQFDNDCAITLAIRKSKADELRTKLANLSFE